MKKIILSLVLLLSMTGAQTASAFSFDWGVTAGFNLTKLKLDGPNDKLFSSDNRPGWFIGPKVNVGLIAGFGVDGALLYSQLKYNTMYIDAAQGNLEVSESETVRSFAVPINLKYSIGLGKIANVYIATGPQFDFNIGNKKSEAYIGMFQRENMTTTWNVGVGAKLLGHVDVGVGYNFALSNTAKTIMGQLGNTQIPVGERNDIKANTFKVQLTYYF